MFGDSNSSELQEKVLDLTDRIYNSWVNWVSANRTRNNIAKQFMLGKPMSVHLHNFFISMCRSVLL